MDIREEFEKSEHIKERLEICCYAENIGCYLSIQMCDYASASYLNGAWHAFQEQQKKIDAHNKKLSIFIDELKKAHSNDKDNRMDYWRGFADCAEASVKVFYRDVGFAGED